MVDADPAALLATAAAQPHDPGFVPFVRRAQSAGIPVEVVSDGFGFFIRPALGTLGVGELPVVTARTTFAGRRAADRLPKRQPAVPRVRDVQAGPGPRPPGSGPSGRVHRRRRKRSVCRGLQRRRVRQAGARAHLRRGRLAVPAMDGIRRDRGVARRDGRGVGGGLRRRSPVRAATAVLLRPRGLGRGARGSAAGSWPPEG